MAKTLRRTPTKPFPAAPPARCQWATSPMDSTRRLVYDLRRMIDESRAAVAQAVNAVLVWLDWNPGRRFRVDVVRLEKEIEGLPVKIVAGTMILRSSPRACAPCSRLIKAAYQMGRIASIVIGWRAHRTGSWPCERQSDIAGGRMK